MLFLLPILLLVSAYESITCGSYHRLLSPSPNSQLQIVPKIEVPIAMAPSVQSGMNLRLPITLKFPGGRSDGWQDPDATKTKSRALLYDSIDMLQPSFGKICLLRSICEVSQVPLISPATGLIGEIVDLFLTVSPLKGGRHLAKEYIEAEMRGKSSKSEPCKKYKCPLSIFNVVKLSTIMSD